MSAEADASAQTENPMVGGAPMFADKNIVENAVNSADHTTLVAAVQAAGLVETLQSAGPFTVFAPVNDAFAALPAGTVDTLLKPENKDMLVKVLQDCQAAGLNGSMEADIDTVVANQMALFRAAELARHHAVLETTIEATRAGAPLGSRVTAQNLGAITAANQTLWQQILRMTPERLRLQRKLDTASSSRPSAAAAEPVDLDPVHAWSVSRLLRWIEGPIMDAAPAPLERAKFVVREKTARQEARAKTKMPEKAVRADQDLTDLDIDFAVQNALSTTA